MLQMLWTSSGWELPPRTTRFRTILMVCSRMYVGGGECSKTVGEGELCCRQPVKLDEECRQARLLVDNVANCRSWAADVRKLCRG